MEGRKRCDLPTEAGSEWTPLAYYHNRRHLLIVIPGFAPRRETDKCTWSLASFCLGIMDYSGPTPLPDLMSQSRLYLLLCLYISDRVSLDQTGHFGKRLNAQFESRTNVGRREGWKPSKSS